LLSRVPLYTSADTVIPAAAVEAWFAKVEALDWKKLGLQPADRGILRRLPRHQHARLDVHDAVRARSWTSSRRMRQGRAAQGCARNIGESVRRRPQPAVREELPAGLRLAEA